MLSGKIPRMTEEQRRGWIETYWKARTDGRGTNVKELLISCAILLITMLTSSFVVWIILESVLRIIS